VVSHCVGGIYSVGVCVIVSDLPHVGGIYGVDVYVIASDLPYVGGIYSDINTINTTNMW
jgi:hypothetical protein